MSEITRFLALTGLTGFVGLTLLLSDVRWFKRPPLTDRLVPYAPGERRRRSRALSVATFGEIVVPLSQMVGARLARMFGVAEDLSTRLRRVHSPLDPARFRVRQVTHSVVGALTAAAGAVMMDLAAPLAMGAVFGAAMLAFLVHEQRLAVKSDRWKRRVFVELPVVAEQLGMLTSAGWSLGAAINRVASRGNGACAADLRRVASRMQQGLDEVEALREWGTVADVDSLGRLISILSLNREAADLGHLISDEARTIRREAQRELIEDIERRNQQVWIPVTVAALVPGVLLMGVPFVDALTLFSGS